MSKISANKNFISEVNRIARITNQPQITVYNQTRKDIIMKARSHKTFNTVGAIPSPCQDIPVIGRNPVNTSTYKCKRATRQCVRKRIRLE